MRLLAASLAGTLCGALAAHEARAQPTRGPTSLEATEVGFIPLAGGDSDIGLGVGQLSTIAHYEKTETEYDWRLETAGFITFSGDGGVKVPYQDYYVLATFPNLVPHHLRLDARASFTDESIAEYAGLGNQSPSPAGDRASYYEYGRIHPTVWVRARMPLGRRVSLSLGNELTQSWIHVDPNSKLAADMHSGSSVVRGLLGSAAPAAVDLFEYAFLYDSRDDEFATTRGMYHQATLRLSPGGAGDFPYRYGEADVTARLYATVFKAPLVVVAARFVGNLEFGDPPFYELARANDTWAIGGSNGVRGVPAGRFSGKIKLFENLEVRTDVLQFSAFQKPFTLAAVTFFDAGRLWTDYKPLPQLDGGSLGLKLGVGAGLRLQEQSTFVVRADIAWSPDASPIGAYFAAGEMF